MIIRDKKWDVHTQCSRVHTVDHPPFPIHMASLQLMKQCTASHTASMPMHASAYVTATFNVNMFAHN